MLADDVGDHLANRLPGRLHQVRCDSHRHVVGAGVRLRRKRTSVRDAGSSRVTSRRRMKRRVAVMLVSMALRQTSPSPWAAWPSPPCRRCDVALDGGWLRAMYRITLA